MRILWEIIETPIGEMKKRHRLAERWSKTKHGERIGMPSKLDAMALLGEWAGWKKVQAQVHVNASVEDYSKGLLNSLPQEPGLPNHG